MMSKRVSFSCDGNEFEYPTSLIFNKVGENSGRNNYKKRRLIIGVWSTMGVSPPPDYRRSSSSSSSGGFSSAERFVKGVGAKVARALSFVSLVKITRSSGKVCNSSFTNNLVRSRSYAEPLDDSQRAEAIQDCIQFFNSSSSINN